MINAWKEARTGYPFIDAIMTQLRVEGWIHHLARHAVACFLTRGDLYQHWEEVFILLLTSYLHTALSNYYIYGYPRVCESLTCGCLMMIGLSTTRIGNGSAAPTSSTRYQQTRYHLQYLIVAADDDAVLPRLFSDRIR
jgi:hypothetical protein